MNTDTATFRFESSAAAWRFLRGCDAAGLVACFPSTDGRHTVQVLIPTWMARETADTLAAGAPLDSYAFGVSL